MEGQTFDSHLQRTKGEKVRDATKEEVLDDEKQSYLSRSQLQITKSDKARDAEKVQNMDDEDYSFEGHLSNHEHLKSSKSDKMKEELDLDDDDDYEYTGDCVDNKDYFKSERSSKSSKKEIIGAEGGENTDLYDDDYDVEQGRRSSGTTIMAGHSACQNPTCKGPVHLFLFNMKNIDQKEVKKCLCCAIKDPGFLQRGLMMSLVVGTSLTLINNGDMLFSGNLSSELAWKIVLTYLVPFCVASYASLAAVRIKLDPVRVTQDTCATSTK